MQPAEPGIETEQETQHWRILLGQGGQKLLSIR
jgi:hypothetical protein